MNAIVDVQGLEKRYGAVEAVRGIGFSIAAGSCVGLLGPNGAGKTTTMRMVLGLTRPSAGTVRLFGAPIAELGRSVRARIGLVPQDDNLDPDLTVRENLKVYGRYFGLAKTTLRARVPALLAFMELEQRGDAKVMQLSGGLKRRLVIARSLLNEPELVVLDEPTTGLDPQARVLIWRRVLDLKRQGKTLLLTTHYMDEAQRLCDRIIVIDAGRVLDEGSPQELIERHVRGHVFEIAKPVPEGVVPTTLEQEDIGDAILVYTAEPQTLRDRLPADLAYRHRGANLEDVFLRLTGRRLREV